MWRLALSRLLAKAISHYRSQPIHPWLLSAWQHASLQSKKHWNDIDFLVVDLETSSLSPKDGEILSIGWVGIDRGKVQLNSAQHLLLKNSETVGHSATIHHLRDCQLESGLTLEQACHALLQAATGRVLVFHHSPMDMSFLNHNSLSLFGAKLCLPMVDTLQLEKKYRDQIGIPIQQDDLTLGNIRNHYGLPVYPAHNALTDAIATAELLLAQIAHKGGKTQLKSLLS
jgi:DNA polymerase-3 subunit epsilon